MHSAMQGTIDFLCAVCNMYTHNLPCMSNYNMYMTLTSHVRVAFQIRCNVVFDDAAAIV